MRWIALILNFVCFIFSAIATFQYWPGQDEPYNAYVLPFFLLLFGVVFLLTILYILLSDKSVKEAHMSLYIFNGVTILLFCATYFMTTDIMNDELISDPHEVRSIIYKIDPAGYNKNRTVHYMYKYNETTFQDKFTDEEERYNIGDTLLLKISIQSPSKNIVLGTLESAHEESPFLY